MRKHLLPLALVLAAPAAIAQNCFDGDFGPVLFENQLDFVAPMQAIGFPFPLGGTTYTDIHPSDHGILFLSNAGVPVPPATNNAILYTPTTANLVGGSPKVCPFYSDTISTGGGRVHFKSSASKCVVTWINCQGWGLATPRYDFQAILYPNGDVRFIYGSTVTNNSIWGPGAWDAVVGVSPGGGAILPAPVDLLTAGVVIDPTIHENWTVANTFDMANNTVLLTAAPPGYAHNPLGAPANCASTSTFGTGCGGLGFTMVGRPSLDNSAFTLRATTVPAISPIAAFGFGDQIVNPGVPLDPFGFTGCFLFNNISLGFFNGGLVVSGNSDFPLGIPNNPAFVGIQLGVFAIALSTSPGNIAISNGGEFTIGFGAN